MNLLALSLAALPVALLAYSYAVYPLLLKLFLLVRGGENDYPKLDPDVWPTVSVSLPAYNEEHAIGGTLDALVAADYPADRLQIVVVSDASTDRTDEVVSAYAERGVELLRLSRRSGKTAAENAAASRLRSDIVVNMDASIRILPGSLKALVRPFQDPTVGLASGRDVSVSTTSTGAGAREANVGESAYVDYEMKVRSLETRVGSIVGASGCFYAVRRELHLRPLPDELSRDFAAALTCQEEGYRAVSVREAAALVPRTASLGTEFRRKVRTMTRGLETLWYKRHLLNPVRYGRFSFMLASHKLCRWLVALTLPIGFVGLLILSFGSWLATIVLAVSGLAGVVALLALKWSGGRKLPGIVAVPSYLILSNVAGLVAWVRALRGGQSPTWEPTRRL